MSVREELHNLIERLDDDRTGEALDYLRELARGNEAAVSGDSSRLDSRMDERPVSSRDFFNQPRIDLETLAAQQGVAPVRRFEDLLGDFWPADESAEEFVATVREWRSEGDNA